MNYFERGKKGDLNSFIELISEKTGLPFQYVASNIQLVLEKKPYPSHRMVFREHYFFQRSIYEIHMSTKIAMDRVERYLNKTETFILNYFIGIKNGTIKPPKI